MTTLPIPSTPDAFRREYPEHARTPDLLQILRESHLSASKWSRNHLQALRVLRVPAPGDGHLPILQPHFNAAMEQLHAAENGSILLQLNKLSKLDVMRRTHGELRRQCPQLGSYYANLANVLEPNPASAPLQTRSPSASPMPTRSRQTPLRSGFVTGEGLGFSSPTTASDGIHSSPSFAPSVNAPIDRSEYEDRVKSEEVSRALASEFLSVICDLTRDPTSDRNSSRLEFTSESHTYNIPPLDTTCDDDGSFVLKRFHNGVWRRQDLNAHCCLEAKRIHDQWEEDEDDDVGVITNEVFAQQVGEMLGMAFRRMAYNPSLRDASRQFVESSTILSSVDKTNQGVRYIQFLPHFRSSKYPQTSLYLPFGRVYILPQRSVYGNPG